MRLRGTYCNALALAGLIDPEAVSFRTLAPLGNGVFMSNRQVRLGASLMSTNYSFNVIARRSGAPRLYATLTEQTDSDQLNHLDALFEHALGAPSGPSESSGVVHDSTGNLTFCYPEDDVLKSSVFAPLVLREGSQAGCIPVGGLYTDLWVGGEYVYFQATAMSYAVSRALFDSRSVRAAFTTVGRAADALVVFLDTEGEHGFSIWPGFIRFPIVMKPGWNLDLEMEDLGVDGYCEAVLASMRSASGDPEAIWQPR